MEINPEIIEKDGKKFAVIPFDEYVEIKLLLDFVEYTEKEYPETFNDIMQEILHRG
jgi:predicted house-cleaning noncanonical NTP pyrophosphatase (MazG superfamily)